MSQLFQLGGSIFLIWFGYSNLKMGIQAIKEKERPIGGLNPKHGVVSGPLLIVAGIVVFVRFFIVPLL